MRNRLLLIPMGLALALPAGATRPAAQVKIITSDVDRFYRIYDSAHGHPSAQVLQSDYIDAGSDGVRQFVPQRIISGEAMAEEIAKDHAIYDHARTCASVMPQAKRKLNASMHKLLKLYPEAKTPPVTVLIGRNNSGGTTGPSGVLIGLEVVCNPNSPEPNVEDNLVHIVAHEYAHVQQPEPNGSQYVLRDSLREGVAELVAELTSGQISNGHLLKWTRGHEKEIETAFLADADKKDISDWLYNGVGTPEKPGDLGYWVGYRIAKAYYLNHRDKRAALRELLQTQDPHKILQDSGWHPGIKLPG
jgi:hypothetical protein